jgi:hypothetical protein
MGRDGRLLLVAAGTRYSDGKNPDGESKAH